MTKLWTIFQRFLNSQSQFGYKTHLIQRVTFLFIWIILMFIHLGDTRAEPNIEINSFVCIEGKPISYPSPENSPQVQMGKPKFKQETNGKDECEKLTLEKFPFSLSLTGSFYHEGDISSLTERFGAISKLKGIRYWSVKDKKWETFIVQASALEGKNKLKRADFSAAELTSGSEIYFNQQDNRSSSPVTYLMKIEKANEQKLIVSMVNIDPIRFLLMTIFQPGEVKATYVLEKISSNQWGYFNFVGNKKINKASPEAQEKSSINRAVAFYRHFTGVPTDKEPPFAP